MTENRKKKRILIFFHNFFKRRIVILGVILVLFFLFAAVFAPFLTKYDPYKADYSALLQQPSMDHLLGTDNLGRDVLTRLLYGARTSLLIGVAAVIIAAVIGVLLGVVSGYFGGIIDVVIMRFIDAMMTLPAILIAMALSIFLGKSLISLMFILGLSTVPAYTRLMHAQVLKIKNSDFISAEHILGASDHLIIVKHLIPNCISPLIVLITQNIGFTILAEASLSFLGLGIIPPTASWGAMINDGYHKLLSNPAFGLSPGICIVLLVLGLNIMGDGLRDVFDPRLRGSI